MSNLDLSIIGIIQKAITLAPTASSEELLELSRAARNLDQSENADVEIAINSRIEEISPEATHWDLRALGKTVANLLEREEVSFAGGDIGKGYLPAQHHQQGKYLVTSGADESYGSGSSKTWVRPTTKNIDDFTVGSLYPNTTFQYNEVTGKYITEDTVFPIIISELSDLPAEGSTIGELAYDTTRGQMRFWNGEKWQFVNIRYAMGGWYENEDFSISVSSTSFNANEAILDESLERYTGIFGKKDTASVSSVSFNSDEAILDESLERYTGLFGKKDTASVSSTSFNANEAILDESLERYTGLFGKKDAPSVSSVSFNSDEAILDESLERYTGLFGKKDAPSVSSVSFNSDSAQYDNQPPIISNISDSYVMTSRQNTVITASGADPEGKSITWSYEEVMSGSSGDSKIVVGAQGDNNWGGAVYVYDLDGSNEIKIVPPNTIAQDRVGFDVAVANQKIYISALLEDDESLNPDGQHGSVWIYDLDGSNGQILRADTDEHQLNFGRSVAAAGGKLAVYADGRYNNGKLFIYDADGSNEIQVTELQSGNGYAYSMVMDNSKIVVGNSNNLPVQVFNHDGSEAFKLTGSNSPSSYGLRVAIGSDKIAVAHGNGAYVYNSDGTNEQVINGLPSTPELAIGNGKLVMGVPTSDTVHVYDIESLTLETSFSSSFTNYQFGYRVSIADSKIYVSNHDGAGIGTIEVYDLDGSNGYVINSSNVSEDRYGYSMSVSGGVAQSALNGTTVSQSNNVFTITPGIGDANFTLRFIASDNFGTTSHKDVSFTHDYINAAPEIQGIESSYTLTQEQDTIITATAIDVEGDDVTWSYEIIGDLNEVTVSQSDNIFTITPARQDANFNLKFIATDSVGNVATTTTNIILDYVNQPPVISGVDSSYTLIQGQDTVITASATDIEGDDITWSYEEVISELQSGLAVVQNTGEIDLFDFSGIRYKTISKPTDAEWYMSGANIIKTNSSRILVGGWGSGISDDNDSFIRSGGAFLFNSSGNLLKEIYPPNPTTGMEFGYSIDISENRIVVGAYRTNSNQGSAYVYDIDGNFLFELTAYDGQSDDWYGKSVACNNNYILVAAPKDDTSSVDTGSAYLYHKDGTFSHKLSTPSIGADDWFGGDSSVYMTDNRIAIHSMDDDRGNNAGAVYLYDGEGSYIKKITAPDGAADDLFGYWRSIDITDDYVVIGNAYDDGGDGHTLGGSVYVFDINGNYIRKIIPHDQAGGGSFGMFVTASGNNLFVTRPYDSTSSSANFHGSIYQYHLSNGGFVRKILDHNGVSEWGGYGSRGISTFDLEISNIQEVTVSQSDNVFTVSHGSVDESFTLLFKATDTAGNTTSVTSEFDFTYVNQAPSVTGIESAYTLTQGQDTVITASATDPEGDAITWSYEEALEDNRPSLPQSVYGIGQISMGAVQLAIDFNVGSETLVQQIVNQISSKSNVTKITFLSGDLIMHEITRNGQYLIGSSSGSVLQIYDSAYQNRPNWSGFPTTYAISEYGINQGQDSSTHYTDAIVSFDTVKVYGTGATSVVTYTDNLTGTDVRIGDEPQSQLNGVTITQSDNVFTVTPAQQDATFQLNFKATDTAGNVTSVTSDFAYDYNAPPVIMGIESVYTLTQGVNQVIVPMITDAEGETVTVTYEEVLSEGVPSGLNGTTITQSGNDFTIIPGNADANFTLRFTATDTSGNTDIRDADFSLNYNVNPVLSGIGSSYTLTQDQDTVITAAISDADGDPITLTYAVTSGDMVDTTISQSSNVFTVTPGVQDASFQITFTATDPYGGTSEIVSDFNYDYNAPPVISGIEPVYTLTQGVDEVIVGMSSDADGDAVTWSFAEVLSEGVPSGLNGTTITQNGGEFTVTPGTADANFTIRFTLTDTAGNTDTRDADFSLTYVNQAPAVSGIDAAYTLTQGQDTVITAAATDIEGDAITWSYSVVDDGPEKNYVGIVAVGEQNKIHLYDSTDLNISPIIVTAPDGVYFSRGLSSYKNDILSSAGSLFAFDGHNTFSSEELVSYDAETTDYLGYSMVVHGDKIFLSAPGEESYTGAVYVYNAEDLSAQPLKLTAPDGAESDWFGRVIEIVGDRLYVSAPYDDDVSSNSGSVYVYDINDLSANPIKLNSTGSDVSNYNFGTSISGFSQGKIAIGAQWADNPSSSNSGGHAHGTGAVYVFDENNLTGTPIVLTPSDITTNDMFGVSVSASDDKLFIGCPRDDEGANQNLDFDTVYNSGSVYVYDANNLSATPTKITAPNTIYNGWFGEKILVVGDKLYVGSRYENVNRVQARSDRYQNSDFYDDPTGYGAVYVYDVNNLSAPPVKLTSDSDEKTSFGWKIVSLYIPESDTLNDVTVSQSDNVFTITPGSTDADFQLTFKATDTSGNVTSVTSEFDFDYQNQAPSVTGIDSTYTLTQGQDTVITAAATDPEGDAITWSFEEVMSNYVFVGATGDDDNGSSSGSVYVYDANDLSAQPTKLTAFDGSAYDDFGWSVAATADKIVIGARQSEGYFGSIYVYDTNDLSAQPSELTAFDGAAGDLFGSSVAATADKIVVGAFGDDDNGSTSGSVYVYDANDLSAQPTKLTAFDAAANDRFGFSVAANSDKIFVGAYGNRAVYVYDVNNLSATPTKLTISGGERFGYSVSATNDKIVVGDTYDDDNGSSSGSVYVYDANDLSAQPTKLTAFDGAENDYFGYSVSATNDKIVVGNTYDDDNGMDSGSVYVFDANDLSAQPTKLTAFDGAADDRFGHSVVATTDKIVVGALLDEDNGSSSGSVYVFDANDLSAQPTKLTAFDGAGNDYFGRSVASSSASSALNGVTVSQSDNVFTVTPGSEETSFSMRFTATDANGNATTTTSAFTVEAIPEPQMGDLFIGSDGYSTGDFNRESEVDAWTKTSNTSWLVHRSGEGGHMEMGWGTDNQVGAYIELDVVPNTEYTISFSGTATSGAPVGHANYRDAYVNVRVVDSEPVGTNAAALILQTTPSTTGGTYPNGSTASNGWQPQTSKSGYQTLSGTITPHGSKLTIQILNVDKVVQYFDDFSVTGLVPV